MLGCPDRRIDRLCITCCSPFPAVTTRRMAAVIAFTPPARGCDHVLDRIHHALYIECRERAERDASTTAAIICCCVRFILWLRPHRESGKHIPITTHNQKVEQKKAA